MGEYDRNANPLPLPVKVAVKTNNNGIESTTINTLASEQLVTANDCDDGDVHNPSIFKSLVKLPEGSILRKGHQRVTVFIQHNAYTEDTDGYSTGSSIDVLDKRNSSFSSNNADNNNNSGIYHTSGIIQDAYEVMIHKGEAYLVDLDVDLNIGPDDSNKLFKVIDHSTGWRHSLLLVEEVTTE